MWTRTTGLKELIHRASDHENYYFRISKNGKIKFIKTAPSRIGSCFPSFHNKQKDISFAYDVIRGVIELHENDRFETITDKKVQKASIALFKKFRKQIRDLNEEDKEAFMDLPNYLIMNSFDDVHLQVKERINSLNKNFSNSLGVDIDRLFNLQSLIIQSEETETTTISDPESIKDFAHLLCDLFSLSEELKSELFSVIDNGNNGKVFERFLDKKSNLEGVNKQNLDDMKRLLNGLSQKQYVAASKLLMHTFKQKVAFEKDTHDNVKLAFRVVNQEDASGEKDCLIPPVSRIVEVRHHFNLELHRAQVVIKGETLSLFDLEKCIWIQNSMSFNVAQVLSDDEQEIQDRLEELGYATASN